MRNRALLVAAIALAVAPFLLFSVSILNESRAQTPAPPAVPVVVFPGAKVAWDHTGLDIAGNVDELESTELVVTASSATNPDVVVPLAMAVVPEPSRIYPAESLFSTITPGVYLVWARVVDTSGNRSAWSVPLSSKWDRVPPEAATGLRLSP